jgi:hypothetical protein
MAGARRSDARASMGRILTTALAIAALTLGVAVAPATASPAAAAVPAGLGDVSSTGIVQTADLSQFQPGNIIADAVFFNRSSMTEAQIQSFLQSKVSSCRSGYTCLKDYYDTSRTTSADAMCGAYSGGVRERASRIIYKVAQACGINPQVILVMLQKEQGLVTSTAPGSYAYRAAMGQGCPDTAACDTRYYGFFNQVYGGAWQLKRYANPPGTSQFFTWYAPGKTWDVLYHPNRACGTSRVAIQNQATANLYYYTPYRPNAAALRAGYGTGDSCSSYGNRNFYNYFTDWFGSTQVISARLIQSGDPVYLVSGSRRYHVQKPEFAEFAAVFGQPMRVDSGFVAAYMDSGVATLYLRNASNGDVSFLRGGARHWFPSCTLVAAWGSKCGAETVLTGSDYSRIKSGAAMSWFATTAFDDSTLLIESDQLRPVYDDVTATRLNGGTAPYAALMPSSVATGYESGLTKFLTANYLTVAGESPVLLPTADGRLLHLQGWPYSAEFGLPAATFHTNVPASAVEGYTQTEQLELYAVCGSTTYVASRGTLHPVTAAAVTGFPAPVLDGQICGALDRSTSAPVGKVFVQAAGTSEVYLAENGVYRHVTTRAALTSLTGGTWPRILPVSTATLSLLPKGDPVIEKVTLSPGGFVRSDASTRVYLPLGDTQKAYLPAWTYATELGLATTQRVVSRYVLDARTESAPLGLFVDCAGVPHIAAQGKLRPVAASAVAGFSVPKLDAATCGVLRFASAAPLPMVFVQGIGRNEVYVAQGGVFRHITSRAGVTALTGGSWPTIVGVAPATISVLPKGAPIS